MIIADFKIAIRNILHNKVQSAISTLGLGIGLGSMILLIALIVHEKSFDRFIPDYPNVYKVIFGSNGFAQYPLADAMKKDFPEVKDFFRINQANIVQVRNIKRNEYGRNQEFAFADSSIFKILGIALISIARKTKEIGLRKVNGATIIEVIFLLNKDFVRWVLVSLFIGIPVSYYLMSVWQNRFAYKTELSWWIFALAGISAILVAALTVTSQSWRAATRNPVEALRYE